MSLRLPRLLAVAGACALGCNQATPPVEVVQATDKIVIAETVANQPIAKAAPAKVEPAPATKSFAFPDDAGGQHLAKTLPPQTPPALPAATAFVPRERDLPNTLTNPAPTPTTATPDVPRLGAAPAKAIMPTPLPDRVATDFAPPPELPDRPPLATGPLTRDPARDITKPADLPVLSPQPVPERASLADPTTEFTAQSVISNVLPLRTDVTGFFRFLVPEPFENSAGRAKVVPTDDPNRALGNPPPPKP